VSRRGVIHHALARATRGGCGGWRSPFDKSLGRATFTFVPCHRKRVQRDAARVRGVPESSYPSPKIGGLMYCH
jgi:hypothetical protein